VPEPIDGRHAWERLSQTNIEVDAREIVPDAPHVPSQVRVPVLMLVFRGFFAVDTRGDTDDQGERGWGFLENHREWRISR